MTLPALLRALLLSALVAGGIGAAAPAVAQPLPPATIAVLDYQEVLREAQAAQTIRKQINSYRERYQDEIEREEQVLRQEEQELKRQRSLLSAQAFEERRQAFEHRVLEVQRLAQDRTRSLDRSLNQAMATLQKTVVGIIEELSRETGANLVVDKSVVMVSTAALDITDEVIVQLNQRLPTVEVPQPGG